MMKSASRHRIPARPAASVFRCLPVLLILHVGGAAAFGQQPVRRIVQAPASASGSGTSAAAQGVPEGEMLSQNYLITIAVTEEGVDGEPAREEALLTIATVRSRFTATSSQGGDRQVVLSLSGQLTELVEQNLFAELSLAARFKRPGSDEVGEEEFDSAVVVMAGKPLVFLRSGQRTYTLQIVGIGPETPEVAAPKAGAPAVEAAAGTSSR